jgi:hypothetical protein
MAEALRDDGSNGYWAHPKDASYFSAPDVQARGDVNGRNMYVNVDHPDTRRDNVTWSGIGHESGHNIGLVHAEVNGVPAYRFGTEQERSVFNSLRNTNPAATLGNPDHLMEYIDD